MFIEIADLLPPPVLVAPPAGLAFPSRFHINDGPTVGDAFEEGYDYIPTGLPPGPPLSRIDQYGFGFYGVGGNGQDAAIARGNGLGQLTSALQSVGNAAIQGITFDSTLTGAITIQQPLAPGQPATADVSGSTPWSKAMLAIAQPSIYVSTPLGVIPFEPFGTPVNDYSGLILVAGATTAVICSIAAIWAIKRIAR
jgi:hypothetical protein